MGRRRVVVSTSGMLPSPCGAKEAPPVAGGAAGRGGLVRGRSGADVGCVTAAPAAGTGVGCFADGAAGAGTARVGCAVASVEDTAASRAAGGVPRCADAPGRGAADVGAAGCGVVGPAGDTGAAAVPDAARVGCAVARGAVRWGATAGSDKPDRPGEHPAGAGPAGAGPGAGEADADGAGADATEGDPGAGADGAGDTGVADGAAGVGAGGADGDAGVGGSGDTGLADGGAGVGGSGGRRASVMRERGGGWAPEGRCASVLIPPPVARHVPPTDHRSGQARSPPRAGHCACHSNGLRRPGRPCGGGPGHLPRTSPTPG